MARLTYAELDRLRHTVSLVDLCRSRGIILTPESDTPDTYTGKCPFHADEGASFVVLARQNSFYCRGCAACGYVVDFVMVAEALDFEAAARSLLDALPDSLLSNPKEGAGPHAENS